MCADTVKPSTRAKMQEQKVGFAYPLQTFFVDKIQTEEAKRGHL